MHNYVIGIIGPVSGLSFHQMDEIRAAVREVLKASETVTLQVWRDTGTRHPVDKNPDKIIADIPLLMKGLFLSADRANVVWAEFGEDEEKMLRACDTLLFCPADHASTAKSRVNKLRRCAESLSLKFRYIFAWRSETNHC
jgi:hypothetical protein